ncbi:hypothetical protein [Streptomyces sp. NPDC048392]|uniref:phage tail assembly protein T n=1 Tax=Streptomyces sp. NPDC048392 TaxID=3365543 RepID=UPI00372326D6
MRHLLADIHSDELTEWMAYEQLTGPLGPDRGDLLHGIRAAVIANAAGGKGRKAVPKDFIPKWDQTQSADWQEMLATARVLNSRLGGTDFTQGGGHGDAG